MLQISQKHRGRTPTAFGSSRRGFASPQSARSSLANDDGYYVPLKRAADGREE